MTVLPDLETMLPALAGAIADAELAWAKARLVPMPDRGLAHHHVSLAGTGVLARVPKQSQLQLDPEANLAYQAACFARAGASGHTPALHAVLAPRSGLPRGALLVEHIAGQAVQLPRDLPALMLALASIHSLPLPPRAERPPLWDGADPLDSLVREIHAQAMHLDDARIERSALRVINGEFDLLTDVASRADRPHRRLISFDAHPGNFLIRPDGLAVLVDLEKCRYSYPALDLAHATLYTSTTWEPDICVTLSPTQVTDSYRGWSEAFDGEPDEGWQLPLRRAMWLWSVTWCAKWRVLSDREPSRGVDGEDWAAARSATTVTDHVRSRVDDYLDAAVIDRITAEFDGW